MIRPILIEIGLFLMPFAIYAAILMATPAGMLRRSAWGARRLAALAAVALVLMVGSFVLFAQFSGVPPGSTYIPAHMEGGKFVPGSAR
jgi:uncharacterized protein DUF6111